MAKHALTTLLLVATTLACLAVCSTATGVTPTKAPVTTKATATAGRLVAAHHHSRLLASDTTVLADTQYGAVLGTRTGTVLAFQGIPYAQPPIAWARWQPASTPYSWFPQILNATTPPPACPQRCSMPPELCPSVVNENCLFLSVFTPSSSPAAQLPVVVRLHGGEFTQGGGDALLSDGSSFAANTSSVVVTLNYRLGALGSFVAHGDSDAVYGGNLGVSDQTLALQWVARNIRHFGGDPARVTLWGEGTGATYAAIHTSLTQSKGLFQAAILDSPTFGVPLRNSSELEELSAMLCTALHCDGCNKECLLSASDTAIVAAQEAVAHDLFASDHIGPRMWAWTPAVGLGGLYRQPLFALTAGDAARVPVIMGAAANASAAAVYSAYTSPMAFNDYKQVIRTAFGFMNEDRIIRAYPGTTSTYDWRPVASQALSDAWFNCPVQNASRSLSGRQQAAFVYEFDHPWSFAVQGWGPQHAYCTDLACLGGAVPFLLQGHLVDLFSAAEVNLSATMRAYWGSFVHNHHPQPAGKVSPWWPTVANVPNNTVADVMVFDSQAQAHIQTLSETLNGLQGRCELWDSLMH